MKTYQADVGVDRLDPAVRPWYKQFGVNELLDSQHDSVLCSDSNSGSKGERKLGEMGFRVKEKRKGSPSSVNRLSSVFDLRGGESDW